MEAEAFCPVELMVPPAQVLERLGDLLQREPKPS